MLLLIRQQNVTSIIHCKPYEGLKYMYATDLFFTRLLVARGAMFHKCFFFIAKPNF